MTLLRNVLHIAGDAASAAAAAAAAAGGGGGGGSSPSSSSNNTEDNRCVDLIYSKRVKSVHFAHFSSASSNGVGATAGSKEGTRQNQVFKKRKSLCAGNCDNTNNIYFFLQILWNMFAANLDSVLIRMIGSPCLSQWYKF